MSTPLRYVSLGEWSGYGLAALEYVAALCPLEPGLAWQPLLRHRRVGYGWFGPRPSRLVAARIFRDRHAAIDRINDAPAPQRQVLHTVPELWPRMIDPGAENFGYTVWETDRLPSHWPELLRRVDHVLVPCRSNLELFAEATGKPVTVVPHICRGSRGAASGDELDDFRRRLGIEAGRHVFYSINAWNSRKAPWELIDAYLRAFDADDPVSLVLKTAPRGPRCAEDSGSAPTRGLVEEMRARYRHPAEVIVIDRPLPEREIEMLHMAGDTFVSMARSEGWGLGMFDAAGFGKPVIATGWGGHLDYLDPRHATLLEYSLEPVVDAAGYPSYAPDQNWAKANPDAAVEAMRAHAARHEDYRQRAAPLATAIQRRFNADTVGRILHDTLGLN